MIPIAAHIAAFDPTTARALIAELLALREQRDEVLALHYAADNDADRTPVCETCHGKAGVHECGCWAERDRRPVCGHCKKGRRGASVAYPCATVRALGVTEEGETDE